MPQRQVASHQKQQLFYCVVNIGCHEFALHGIYRDSPKARWNPSHIGLEIHHNLRT